MIAVAIVGKRQPLVEIERAFLRTGKVEHVGGVGALVGAVLRVAIALQRTKDAELQKVLHERRVCALHLLRQAFAPAKVVDAAGCARVSAVGAAMHAAVLGCRRHHEGGWGGVP